MKPESRIQARRLRSLGMSVSNIAKQCNVARSSVSVWVRDIEITAEQKASLFASQTGSPERYKKTAEINRLRAENVRISHQEKGRHRARVSQLDMYLAGCLLYWAEGSKNRSYLTFSNSDPDMIRFFMKFLRESLELPNDRIVITIRSYDGNDLSIEEIENYWLAVTQLTKASLRKGYHNKISKASKGIRKTTPMGTVNISVSKSGAILQGMYGAIGCLADSKDPKWLYGTRK